MEAAIDEAKEKMILLLKRFAERNEVIQFQRNGIYRTCKEYGNFIYAIRKVTDEIEEKKQRDVPKVNDDSSITITQKELASVQSLLEEAKLIRQQHRSSDTKINKKHKSYTVVKAQEMSRKKSDKTDCGTIPKRKVQSAPDVKKETTEPDLILPKFGLPNEVRKCLNTYDRVLKSLPSNLQTNKCRARNEFMSKININYKSTELNSGFQIDDEPITYSYKNIDELANYNQLIYEIQDLQLENEVLDEITEIIPLIERINSDDENYLPLLRLCFHLSNEKKTFPIFLKDNF